MRLLRAIAGIGLALGIVIAVAMAALTWRLAQGPLDVTSVAQRAARSYAPGIRADRLTLAWDGFNGGPRSLHLVASAPDLGAGAVTADKAAVALSLTRLIEGRIEPTDIVVDGLRLHATRRADGSIVLDGIASEPGGGHLEDDLRILDHVSLKDATLTVLDAASGQSLDVGGATLDLERRPRGAIAGHGEARLTLDGVAVTASLKAERDAGAVTRMQIDISPVSPAALSRTIPLFAPLAMLEAAVSLHGEAELGPDLVVRHAAARAQASEGIVQVPAKGGGTSPAHFASASLNLEGDLNAVQLHELQIVLAPPSGSPPTTITVSGDARRARGRAQIHVAATLDHFSAADLPSIWPPRTGGGARPWLTENLTAGAVHDGHFTLLLEGPDTSLDDLVLTQAGGTMAADDVTLWWLRPLPPIDHGQAVLTLENPDAMLISFTGARLGRITERSGNIHITAMSTPHQFGLITADLAAPVADVVKLLSYPRLNMLSSHPLPLDNPSGDVAGHLTVHIPLENHVVFDDVAIHVSGQVSNLHLGGFAEGQDLDQGMIAMDVTNDALKASGTALLANMPSTVQADMDFRNGGPTQVTEHVAVALRATPQQLAGAGLDTHRMVGGAVAVKLDYAGRRNATATVQLNADILETSFDTPAGWTKAAGSAGFVEARAQLLHGRLVGVDRLRAEAPGLSLEGHSEVIDGRASVLHVDRAVVGRSSATGTVGFSRAPGDPIRVVLAGPRLDLTSLLDSRPGAAEPAKPEPAAAGQPMTVDLRFGKVLMKQGSIGPVTLTAEGSTTRVTRAQLRSSSPDNLEASLTQAGATRHLSVKSADFGSVLRAFETTTAVAGGHLTLTGDFDDAAAGSPFTGVADLDDFRIRGAPFVGKVLQGLTLYGLVDALRGPGLVFDKLSSPFRLTGSRLELMDARAFSSSLGITAKGEINLNRKSLVLDGTIVPAYALNALPGVLPLIGRLFSPERGGGVFAATYSLNGSIADPTIRFNPLAALTPGFLRGLFGMLP